VLDFSRTDGSAIILKISQEQWCYIVRRTFAADGGEHEGSGYGGRKGRDEMGVKSINIFVA
jgi:hypothetical protein